MRLHLMLNFPYFILRGTPCAPREPPCNKKKIKISQSYTEFTRSYTEDFITTLLVDFRSYQTNLFICCYIKNIL
jgi:hypothetical protein